MEASFDYMPDQDIPPPDMETAKGIMVIIYCVVFFIGTPGNLWIVYKLLRARLWSSSAAHLTVSQRSRLYILALACSDLLLLLTLPFTASYNFYGTWIFGEALCYITLTIEIVTKIFSVVLLTVMSLERYVIVCTRLRNSFQSWMSLVPLALGTFFGVVLPSIFHFVHIIHQNINFEENERVDVDEFPVTICIPNMDENIFVYYAHYTFVTGFVIPFIIMTSCYILLVRHVKQKFRNRKGHLLTVSAQKRLREPRYLMEMRKSIWRIAIFHFICWAPFWLFTITPFFVRSFAPITTIWVVYGRLFANSLPYINAAGNWVLYAVLNSDVRKHIYHQPQKTKISYGFNAPRICHVTLSR
ncbi:unnamed protein product [Auanema sp. JU1783]|nr:unnamed protein product [Auanema sp. JU1783]